MDTQDMLAEAVRLAADAAVLLTRAENLLANPGDDPPTEDQLRTVARYRLALADARDVLDPMFGDDSG